MENNIQLHKANKTALLFGSTGLVGSFLLDFLANHAAYEKVITFVRKPIPNENPKIIQYVIDFDKPNEWKHLIAGDDLFCCIGTTMKKAGDKETFRKVDFTYAYQIATIASENKVNQFLLVSSVGADENSMFFYNRVKGELESALKRMNFWSVHIFQPSILLGERNENRFGEDVAQKLGKFFDSISGGLLTKYKPVEADVVAKAMVNAAQGFKEGVFTYPSHLLQKMSEEEDNVRKLF